LFNKTNKLIYKFINLIRSKYKQRNKQSFQKKGDKINGNWKKNNLTFIKNVNLNTFTKYVVGIKDIIFKLFIENAFWKLVIKGSSLPKLKFNFSVKKRYFVSSFFVLLICFFFYFFILKDLPKPSDLTKRQIDVSTKIYDRNNILLYTIYKDKNRSLVSLNSLNNNVKYATIAAEDAEFYNHPGFSIKGILRAIFKNVRDGKIEGGSTITQQLVKNALLSSEKTYVRKIRELILSVGVEMKFNKDEILEMYLNEVSYGGNVYGIQQASIHYFGKNAKDLNLAESALLAGLPQSPTRYSPFGNNPDLTFSRQREVLHLMKINKFITEDDEKKALTTKITFAPNKQQILAPHFVMYIREKLIEEYGEEMVLKGGLSVKTTLDINIQTLAEKAVKEELLKLKKLNVNNSGVIVLDPKTNDILAMVGSVDYFDWQNDGNVNVTTRLRQPGSSIKPVNYALGLSNGLTLASTIDDSPISFKVLGQKPYTPKNYDGAYKGKITLRQALAQSRNIPAVKILASNGVNNMINLAEKMGITTWKDRSRYGLSLTLGGGETKLIEMAQVYSVFANLGVKKDIQDIVEIKNYENKTIFSSNKNSKKSINQIVLDPRVSYLIIDVLRDNISRSPAFGLNSMLVIPNHPEVAVKTGTSNELKDNLTIGFNQNYLVAVWVGNNNGSPMSRIASGITGAAPIWNKIMRALVENQESTEWTIPSGLVNKDCFGKKEWFLEERQLSCPKIIEPAAMTINMSNNN
jgi:1A family penicillin-binding protein